MKLSDNKFIARSIERAMPKTAEKPDPSDLAALRGIAEKPRREAQHLTPGLDGAYEPVSFAHPHDGRRIYGWLVAVDTDGNARIEIGDGEYASVPPTELRRLGAQEDREKIQAQLRRSIGQVSLATDGVRADLHETTSLMPLADDNTLQLLSLAYSTSYGLPTDRELTAFVERFHPTASIVEVDVNMPGRVGLALQFQGGTHEAEMDGAHGGEVQEVLDPADVSEEAKHNQGTPKQAIWPFNKAPKTPVVTPQEAAQVLSNKSDKDLAEKALKIYFDNGGIKFLAQLDKPFNSTTLLAAAMPVVQRVNPPLYKEIALLAVQEQAAKSPTKEPVKDPAKAKEKPTMQELIQSTDPFQTEFPSTEEDIANLPNNGGVQIQNPVNASKRSALFERTADKARTSRTADKSTAFSHLTQHGLPPAMTDIFNTMKMHRFARRGDYIMARVEWDPAVVEGRSAHSIKHTVISFVKAKAGSTRQGANFGVIGKIYVLSIDEKKGEAQVQFASEHAGPAPTSVVTE